MFALCDPTAPDSGQDDLELHERSGDLETLLRLLHSPPAPPTKLPSADKFCGTAFDPATVIPLPLLFALFFPLADKYMLAEVITRGLRAHLVANAPAHALEVYSFAARHGMEAEAARASQFVRPVASYRFAEITVLPDVVAYHKLVRLQDFRVKALRDLLLGEDIFPHGASLARLLRSAGVFTLTLHRLWGMPFPWRRDVCVVGQAAESVSGKD